MRATVREGMLAEYPSAAAVLAAVVALRARGYRLLDAYTPFPVKGLEEALGLSRSFVGRLVFPLGALGAVFAFSLQALLNAYLYPLNTGGRPPLAAPAFIIITFETTVLFAGVGAFGLLFWLCRLPHLTHPVLDVEGFESATLDRFWVGVNVRDPLFSPERTYEELRALGATRVDFAGGRR